MGAIEELGRRVGLACAMERRRSQHRGQEWNRRHGPADLLGEDAALDRSQPGATEFSRHLDAEPTLRCQMTPECAIEELVERSLAERLAWIADYLPYSRPGAVPVEHRPRSLAQFVLFGGEDEVHIGTIVPISMT
jgi:hypothetical protein